MNKEDKIFQILKEIKEVELSAGRKRYDAMPVLFFFLGLGAGLLFNLSSNIMHETFKKFPGNIYEITVLILTGIFVVWFLIYLKTFYLNPVKESEKKVNKLIAELKQELIK